MAGGVFNGCAVRRGDGQNTDPSTRIGSMRALQSIYTFIAHALVIYTVFLAQNSNINVESARGVETNHFRGST